MLNGVKRKDNKDDVMIKEIIKLLDREQGDLFHDGLQHLSKDEISKLHRELTRAVNLVELYAKDKSEQASKKIDLQK